MATAMVKMSGMTLDRKLSMLCDARGWKQTDLMRAMAKATNYAISKASVNAWFNARGRPDLISGLHLARTLGVPLDYLADDALDDPPAPELSDEERFVLDVMRRYGLDAAEAVRGLAIIAERRTAERPAISGAVNLSSGPRERRNEGSVLDGLSLRATNQPRPRKAEPDGDVVREDITDQVRRRKRGEPDRKKGAG